MVAAQEPGVVVQGSNGWVAGNKWLKSMKSMAWGPGKQWLATGNQWLQSRTSMVGAQDPMVGDQDINGWCPGYQRFVPRSLTVGVQEINACGPGNQ